MENTAATQPPGAPNGAYQRIWDENEFLSVQVPVAWEEVESGVWPPDGSAPGTYVKAAPDLDEFEAGTGPGLFLAVTHAGAPSVPATEEPAVQIRASLVQASDAAASWAAGCEQASAADYQDPFYAGVLTSYAGCVQASAPATRLMLSAMPLTQQYVVSLHIAPPAEQGQATVDRILRTFQVVAPSLTDLHHEDEHVQ
jgi:hypothetical protein